MDELKAEGITVQKIDVDSNPEICQSFNIRNVPTVVLQVENVERGRKVGLNPKSTYLEMYNQG
jgi:thioredoxin-like negative regulator of GroEL